MSIAKDRKTMFNGVKKWRLHVGVHKCATTHLQDTLLACRADLRRHGVHYISKPRLQAAGFIRFLRHGELVRSGPLEMLLPTTDAACMRARLVRRSRGCRVGLISEERVLGRAIDLIDGFYPRLEQNLRSLTDIVGTDLIDIYLSIRSQSDVLPSAYAQSLRTHSRTRPFEDLVSRWLSAPPRWTDLIDRIQWTLPHAKLSIWTYEDYAKNPAAVVRELAGTLEIPVVSLPRPERTARLSKPAAELLESLQPLRLGGDAKRRMTAHAANLDGPIYDPTVREHKAVLTEAYKRDLVQIEQRGLMIGTSCRNPGRITD